MSFRTYSTTAKHRANKPSALNVYSSKNVKIDRKEKVKQTNVRHEAKLKEIKALLSARSALRTFSHNINNLKFTINILSVSDVLIDFNVIVDDNNSMDVFDIQKIIINTLKQYIIPHIRTTSAWINYNIKYDMYDEESYSNFDYNYIQTNRFMIEPSSIEDGLQEMNDQADLIINSEYKLVSSEFQAVKSPETKTIESIIEFSVQLSKLQNTDIRAYTELIGEYFKKLPSSALLIPKNLQDNNCFVYAIALLLENEQSIATTGKPVKQDSRISLHERKALKPFIDMYDFSPCLNENGFQVKKLKQAETILGRKIFLYSCDEDLKPLRFKSTSQSFREKEPFNVFLMPSDFGGDQIYSNTYLHAAGIINLKQLIYGKSKNFSNIKKVCSYCRKAFHNLDGELRYDEHIKECIKNYNSDTLRSVRDSIISCTDVAEPIRFKNYGMRTKLRFMIISDFETSSKNKLKQHKAVSFAILFIENDKTHSLVKEVSDDPDKLAISWWKHVTKFREYASERLQKYPKLPSNIDRSKYSHVTCYLCTKPIYNYQQSEKVLHHCHYSNEVHGYCHERCNLAEQSSKQISCYFHNMNFDLKLIMGHMHTPIKLSNNFMYTQVVEGVAKSSEKIASLKVKGYTEKFFNVNLVPMNIFDTLAFLNSSLETAAKNLSKEQLVLTNEYFKSNYGDSELLYRAFTQKGIFPYEHFDYEMLSQTTVPTREQFENKLSAKPISDNDYLQVQLVWNELAKIYPNMTFKQYHDMYIDQDVFLLADCWIDFRNLIWDSFELECGYNSTLPGAGNNCMLFSKQRDEEQECYTLTDKELYLLFEEKAKVGGYSAMGCRTNKPGNILIYTDASALYSCAMSEFALPHKYIRTITDETECKAYVNNFNDQDIKQMGFIECVIDYYNDDPEKHQELCKTLKNYPNFPYNSHVKAEWLSPLQKELASKTGTSVGKTTKLIMTFDEREILVDMRYLHAVLKNDHIRIKSISKIILFESSFHLKPFITKCRDLRNKIKSKSGKNNVKLVSNSVYGKSMQNKLNYSETKFKNGSNLDLLVKYNNKPSFKSRTIVNENTIIYSFHKEEIKLDISLYVGCAILSLSKKIIYDYIYNNVEPFHKANGIDSSLLFTDTDSYAIQVTPTKDITNNEEYLTALHKHSGCIDFSSWPSYSPVHMRDHPTLNSSLHEKRAFTFGSEFVPDCVFEINIPLDQIDQVKKDLTKLNLEFSQSGFFYDKFTIVYTSDCRDSVSLNNICPSLNIPKTRQILYHDYAPDTFYGIKAKQYVFANTNTGVYSVKSKGISKAVLDSCTTLQDYKDIVLGRNHIKKVDFFTLQSKNNVYRTLKQTKVAINSFDDKVYFDNIHDFKYYGGNMLK